MLMKKWLHRDAPGYERTRTDGIADIQKVTAVADTVTELGFVLAGGLFGGAKDTLDRCMTKLHDVMWCC